MKQKAKFQQTIKKNTRKKELLNKEEEEEETFVHIDKESSITHAHHYGHTNVNSYTQRAANELM